MAKPCVTPSIPMVDRPTSFECHRTPIRPLLRPKKVGTLAVAGSEVEKQTNEIKTAAPLLVHTDILGRTTTADALLTQRELAKYLVARGAHYYFTVKLNQRQLYDDIACYFPQHGDPAEFVSHGNGENGRIEVRRGFNHHDTQRPP